MILRRATESGQGVYVTQFYICDLEKKADNSGNGQQLCGTIFTLIEGANSRYRAPQGVDTQATYVANGCVSAR